LKSWREKDSSGTLWKRQIDEGRKPRRFADDVIALRAKKESRRERTKNERQFRTEEYKKEGLNKE